MRIFISSVQKEFAKERKALGEYLANDPLLRRFFDSFLFERDVPASDRRPDEVYLDEVGKCDLYIGLLGSEYGWENADGLSPTHLEFNEATRLGKTRLIFVKGATDESKHPKMQALIREVGSQLVRRRFQKSADLLPDVYASLVDHLEEGDQLNRAPWDARAARKARLDDIDPENIARFVRRARKARNFPLLAEPLYLTKYIERMGTGTRDMIRKCVAAGLPEPAFTLTDGFVTTIRRPVGTKSASGRHQVGTKSDAVTPPVTPPVATIVLIRLIASTGPLGNSEILAHLGLSDRTHLRERYIDPALSEGVVERTIPEKPTSRLQKYRLTEKGRQTLDGLETEGGEA